MRTIANLFLLVIFCVNRKKCDENLKKKLMKELHDLIRGKLKQVCDILFFLMQI